MATGDYVAAEEGETFKTTVGREDLFEKLKVDIAKVTMQLREDSINLDKKIASQERLAAMAANSDASS